jgi:hypothetical protein
VQNYEYCANPDLIHDRNCSTLAYAEVAGYKGNVLADTQSNDMMAFSPANVTCPGCGWVNFHSPVHSDLIFLFDAGWGGGRPNRSAASKKCGGSLQLDPVKFDITSENGKRNITQSLDALSSKVAAHGWHGAGIWIGNLNVQTDECQHYWQEQIQVSKEAGIIYWKVDGPDEQALISPIARNVDPNLIVEHATGGDGPSGCGCTNDWKDGTFPAERGAAAVQEIHATDTFR